MPAREAADAVPMVPDQRPSLWQAAGVTPRDRLDPVGKGGARKRRHQAKVFGMRPAERRYAVMAPVAIPHMLGEEQLGTCASLEVA